MERAMEVLKHAVSITAFVFAVMLLVEYINVHTRNGLTSLFRKNRFMQYVAAALLGIIPGCLGSFALVTLYLHGSATLGALAANMIATSGDEMFVMLAVIPKEAAILTAILFALGIAAAFTVDALYKKKSVFHENDMPLHDEGKCICLNAGEMAEHWKKLSPARGMLFFTAAFLLLMFISGAVGPQQWNYVRVTFIIVYLLVMFVVATVPDHFLEEHLWRHVMLMHVPVVFLWTFGILGGIEIVRAMNVPLPSWQQSKWVVLVMAALLGIIPESGPHLVIVMLFAEGTLPFSVLLANSVVQDGHGMLPLLAHSRKDFLKVKIINLAAGLAAGAALMFFGL